MPLRKYSDQQIADCQADWESGQTIEQIAANHNIPVRTVDRWPRLFGWKKGALIPAIADAKRERAIKHLSKLGFKEEDAFNVLVKCIHNAKRTVFEGQGEQMIATPEEDWDKILKALDMVFKLIDAYPAKKVEIDFKGKVLLLTQIAVKFIPQEMQEAFGQAVEEAGVFNEQ